MQEKSIFTNGTMQELFGSYEDEHGRLYLGVYHNELKGIQDSLFTAKDIFTKSEMATIVKFLFYDCFGDSVKLEEKTCKKIAEQIRKYIS